MMNPQTKKVYYTQFPYQVTYFTWGLVWINVCVMKYIGTRCWEKIHTLYVHGISRNIVFHANMNHPGYLKPNYMNKLWYLIADSALCFFFCQRNFQLLWENFDNDVSIIAIINETHKENRSVLCVFPDCTQNQKT